MLLAGVLWLPVAIDQVTGDPGNLTAVARFSGDEGRASLGTSDAVDAVLRAGGPPPLQLSRDVTGYDLTRDLGAAEAVGGVVALVGLAALTVLAWTRDRPLAALGPVGLAIAAAGFVATHNVPDSLEAGRINLYRWTWVLAFVVWWAAGWVTARALVRGFRRSSRRLVGSRRRSPSAPSWRSWSPPWPPPGPTTHGATPARSPSTVGSATSSSAGSVTTGR